MYISRHLDPLTTPHNYDLYIFICKLLTFYLFNIHFNPLHNFYKHYATSGFNHCFKQIKLTFLQYLDGLILIINAQSQYIYHLSKFLWCRLNLAFTFHLTTPRVTGKRKYMSSYKLTKISSQTWETLM